MTGAKIGSVIIVAVISQSWGWAFLCGLNLHTFSAYNYHDGGTCLVCIVCLCKSYCTQPSRQISTSIHLSVLDCALKAGWWSWARFHAGGKILSVWSRRQKYGQHNRISSLVSAILPHRDIPMGTHFCCANHRQISAGRFLSGHERREDGRGRCKKGGGEKGKRGSPGNDNTWNSLGGLWILSHHHFVSRYCTYPY